MAACKPVTTARLAEYYRADADDRPCARSANAVGAGMNKTPIRWSTHTWNCWSGCERNSPACRFCYAETKAKRMRSTPAFPSGFELTYRLHKLRDPLKIKEPALVFVNSMSDFFDERVPDERRNRLLDIMRVTPHQQFQVLTKRPRVLVDNCDRPDILDNTWLGVKCRIAAVPQAWTCCARRARRARTSSALSHSWLTSAPTSIYQASAKSSPAPRSAGTCATLRSEPGAWRNILSSIDPAVWPAPGKCWSEGTTW
jgi:hypothetical protein